MEQQNQDPNPSTRNRAGSSSGSTGLQVSVEDARDTRTRLRASSARSAFPSNVEKVSAKCFLVSSPLTDTDVLRPGVGNSFLQGAI